MKALFVGIAMASALTAQNAPPQQPQSDGPSLQDTMKFLQDKIAGKVNYVVYWHNSITGADGTPAKSSIVLDNVSADAEHCSIRYHFRNSLVDLYDVMYLKDVREIVFIPLDQSMQQLRAKAGHPEESAKVDPPIFVVNVNSEGKHPLLFSFYDENMSQRVANALQHAVDLCGGGSKEPF